MSGPEVITLGCRLNHAESAAIRTALGARDMVVINGCAVTEEAMRDTSRAVRRAARARPSTPIVVTGCAAQIDPARFAAMPEVAQVIGNQEKRLGPGGWGLAETDSARVAVADIARVHATAPQLAVAYDGRTRAFVEVQNGCDHRCTFCIIPLGRGPSRSFAAGAVIDRVAALVDEGAREVVLTGVDLTSYGQDLPGQPTLGRLVERILVHVPALPRLRLSSLDGIEIDERLFALLTQEPRVMPHVHLSLQAGDDLILKRMKRRHSRTQALALVDRLRAARPEIAIGADLIAGFPTEDEAMAERSRALIAEAGIVHAHIFPYSPRTGTPAALMPQVDRQAVRSRAARMRASAADVRARWLAGLIGTLQAVLVERGGMSGHAPNFAPVRFAVAQPAGAIVETRITGCDAQGLIGETL